MEGRDKLFGEVVLSRWFVLSPNFPCLLSMRPPRDISQSNLRAKFLSSCLLHHSPRFNLLSPSIFHSLFLLSNICSSHHCFHYFRSSAADCHLDVMSTVGKSLLLPSRPFFFIVTSPPSIIPPFLLRVYAEESGQHGVAF